MTSLIAWFNLSLSLSDQSISLLFWNRRYIVALWNNWSFFRSKYLFFIFLDNLFFLHKSFCLFDLKQGMRMICFSLAHFAKIEILTQNTLIANTNNSIFIFTWITYNIVIDQLYLFRFRNRGFKLLKILSWKGELIFWFYLSGQLFL